MRTLMTVFSGVAALMCLLVGAQLLFLESQLGQAADLASADPALQFPRWMAEARTGAVMSLGAGVLIFLFGLRHRKTVGRPDGHRRHEDHATGAVDEFDSLSVRVFEVDGLDRTVEIPSEGVGDPTEDAAAEPVAWAPLAELADDPDALDETSTGKAADPADSILRSIHEATAAGPGSWNPPARPNPLKSLLDKLFRRPRRR